MNSTEGQIGSKELKTLEDQMNYESLATKKFRQSAQTATSPDIKSLFEDASKRHKKHYDDLLNYLNSHS